jgi:hypothetical protein
VGPNWWFANPINVAAGPTGPIVITRYGGNYAATFRGTITLNNNVIIRNESNSDRTAIEGPITGTGNVTVEGIRVNFDNTNNDWGGNLIINPGGQLQLNNNYVVPATADVTNNGTLSF